MFLFIFCSSTILHRITTEKEFHLFLLRSLKLFMYNDIYDFLLFFISFTELVHCLSMAASCKYWTETKDFRCVSFAERNMKQQAPTTRKSFERDYRKNKISS